MVWDGYRAAGYLFNGRPWQEIAVAGEKRIKEEIASINADRLLNTSVEDLVSYFTKKEHKELPRLSDEVEVDSTEIQIDVSRDPARYVSMQGPYFLPGIRVTVAIQFSGDAEFFDMRPSSYTLNPPRASVSGQTLTMQIEGTSLGSSQVQMAVSQLRNEVNQYLSWLSAGVANWNNMVPRLARQSITERRERLLAANAMVASLGFKMKARNDAPLTYAHPAVRRKVTPMMPAASSAPYKPEPALPPDEYEHILKVMHDMALVMERSPAAFQTIGEEAIRTHFLVSLNSHYEGQATGETFNGAGKTDILIRADGRNIFIAECKVWGGPKVLTETVDQILGYATWRDTKLAIIIFNRNRNFGAVLDSITPTIEGHPSFKRTLSKPHDTSFRFIMAQRDDRNREMTLTVLAFDVPQPAAD